MPEAVVRRYSVKKGFLKSSQNSQENTCVRAYITKEVSGTGLFPVNFAQCLPFL